MNEGLMPMIGTDDEASQWLGKNQLPSSLHTFLQQMLAQKGELKFIHTFPENGDYLLHGLGC